MKKWLLAVTAVFGLVSVSQAALQGLPDFTQLVEKEGRAVVNISTTSTEVVEDDEMDMFRQFGFPFAPPSYRGRPQPKERQAQSLGSGFIIDDNGYLLTNAHVVASATEITVKLSDKRTFKAKLVGADARTDVALLKIEASNLPKVDIGDVNTLKVGEWVVAIGAPFGLENTVTAGIVSAKERNLPDENFVPFIQTDAAVNPGNSGGPLFNLSGQVVGINSQIYSRSGGYMGLSFAIPIDVAMKVADELKRTGKVQRARIGVTIQEVSDEIAKGFGLPKAAGALVNAVEKNGPADKAGVKAGDIILKFNDKIVASSSDLPKMVTSATPGTPATLEVWRNKAKKKLDVTLGELDPQDSRHPARNNRENNEDSSRFGLTIQDLSPIQVERLGVKFGVQVRGATGAAAKAGLQPGDVIVGVGSMELVNLKEFKKALQALKAGEGVPLRVIRNDQSLYLILKAPK